MQTKYYKIKARPHRDYSTVYTVDVYELKKLWIFKYWSWYLGNGGVQYWALHKHLMDIRLKYNVLKMDLIFQQYTEDGTKK